MISHYLMFCYVMFCYMLIYSTLFCFVLFCFMIFYFANIVYYRNIYIYMYILYNSHYKDLTIFSQFYGCISWKNHGNHNLWCHETWLATPHPISSCQVFSLRHSAQEIWSRWSRWSHCSLRLLFTGDSEDSDDLVEDFEDDSEVFKDSEDLLEGSVRPSIVFTSGFAGGWFFVSR